MFLPKETFIGLTICSFIQSLFKVLMDQEFV